jgi:hypothetical protein
VRDESDEQVRIVLVPKSRNVDPELLKESLYKLTDLETRFALNLNVLDATRTPMVMGLHELLSNWVAHQIDILQRRSRHRLQKIADRLELVEGYIIAFLNLDRVIEIIRTEDEPKPVMMAEFGLTDRQAEAILEHAPAPLRKLEEMELRKERDELLKEQGELELLLDSPARQRTRLKRDLAGAAQGIRRGHRARAAGAPRSPRRARGRVHDGRDDREGAGHGDPLAARLDPRGEGPPAARAGLEVQGRRRPGLRVPRADHRQAAARRGRRPLLHARRRQAARCARVRRADPQRRSTSTPARRSSR